MKTKQLIFVSMLGLAVLSLTFTSCKKKADEEVVDNDTQASSDNSFAEGSFNDAANIADEAGLTGSVSSYKMAPGGDYSLLGCATLTYDSANKMITIDFGAGACQGVDGKYRSGKIIVTYNGAKFRDSLCVRTITFQNYMVNGNKLDGKKTVQYLGHINGNMKWKIDVTSTTGSGFASITYSAAYGGGTISWERHGYRTLLSGENSNHTINWGSSKWQIEGSGKGVSAKSQAYDFNIDVPLVKNFGCPLTSAGRRHFVSGKFTLKISGKPDRSIDYGNGDCDDDAVVTINGKTFPIKLK